MGKFTVIPENTFDALELDAGVLLRTFNPDNPVAPKDEDIICATTGGINPSCVPTYSDFGEDVDNVPNNMMEFKHLDGWDCKISTTGLGTSPELIRLALGAADVVSTKITPRSTIQLTDYSDLWWVGDKANGGMVAVRLMNALSTGGFSLQTTKNGKGTVSLEITGHVSIKAQSVVPMEFYSSDANEEIHVTGVGVIPSALGLVEEETAQLEAVVVPANAGDKTVTWSSDDSTVATVSEAGLVTAVGAGTATITVTTTDGGLTDTCEVTVEEV